MKRTLFFMNCIFLYSITVEGSHRPARAGINYMPQLGYNYDFTQRFSRLAYSAGFVYSINLSMKWDFNAGINYSFLATKPQMQIYPERDMDYDFPFDSTLLKVGGFETSHFLTVPVTLGFIIHDKNFRITVNSGFIAQLLLDKKETKLFEYRNGEVTTSASSSPKRNVLFTPAISASFDKPINDKMSFKIEPTWFLQTWNYRDFNSFAGINIILLLSLKH